MDLMQRSLSCTNPAPEPQGTAQEPHDLLCRALWQEMDPTPKQARRAELPADANGAKCASAKGRNKRSDMKGKAIKEQKLGRLAPSDPPGRSPAPLRAFSAPSAQPLALA